MKRVYRCRSGSAAHRWIDVNKHSHESHEPKTLTWEEAGVKSGDFNSMMVVKQRIRVPDDTGWKWTWSYSVYHSDNDGGGREEIDHIQAA